MNRIEDLTSGRYVITTQSGTRHYLDFDAGFSVRESEAHPWNHGGPYMGVTPDGQHFRMVSVSGIWPGESEHTDSLSVGQSVYQWNKDEWRISTPIKSIERV